MFKKTITYTDFNDQKITQDFYFHMSKAELLEMAAGRNELLQRLQSIIATQDQKAILAEVRNLVERSCGVRSEDGSRFIKTPEAQSFLMDSPAYDELLVEMCTEADAFVNFVQQLVPEKMQKELRAALEKQKDVETVDPFKQPAEDDPRPAWMKEERNPTPQELREMDADQLRIAFQHRR